MTVLSHVLGFPRIGPNRELKKALEQYWNGSIDQPSLFRVGRRIRQFNWKQQKTNGIDLISVGDFSWYDHVLHTSVMLGNVPKRHARVNDATNLDTLFRMSRSDAFEEEFVPALEMKKWFNTNYHYLVPELSHGQQFSLGWTSFFDELDEALRFHNSVKPILLGPITYLWLGKTTHTRSTRLDFLPQILTVYRKILAKIRKRNIEWIQMDEPILSLELPQRWVDAYLGAYRQLTGYAKILLTTYFGSVHHHIRTIRSLPVDGLHVDCVHGDAEVHRIHQNLPRSWVLSVGIVNGRNVWRTDLHAWFKILHPFVHERTIWVASSCSLLHSPLTLSNETRLDPNTKKCLSFAVQKCRELRMLRVALNCPNYQNQSNLRKHYEYVRRCALVCPTKHASVSTTKRSSAERSCLSLPLFPTTTIGSFPQTPRVRQLRNDRRTNRLDEHDYRSGIRKCIKYAIRQQEELGLDVLVHGEFERNDMVEYFGEHLNGFVVTDNGWVQSYGSRCVKPPVVVGDVSRRKPITVEWIGYAQSLTSKPVKGILTGPLTMMLWSFVREDVHRKHIVRQISSALREEIFELENAGVRIIQIDEPALREGLPLKDSEHSQYLEWAIQSFRSTVAEKRKHTKIHTHLCYSELREIFPALVRLNADVITLEASRSDMKVLRMFRKHAYRRQIGPGVYDVHSPNVPDREFMLSLARKALRCVSAEQLWINPDCGLKTRSWNEAKRSLRNMVDVASVLRSEFLPSSEKSEDSSKTRAERALRCSNASNRVRSKPTFQNHRGGDRMDAADDSTVRSTSTKKTTCLRRR